jgi:diguanylate cyclase (GGDEF)-like protein
MQIDKKILQKISYQTIDSINNLAIVTPAIYSSLFFKFATEYGISLDEEIGLANAALEEKILEFTNLQNETSKNIQQLSEHTSNAVNAIQMKDEAALNDILMETKKLKDEIEKLKASVYKDELTGAFNRKWFNDNFLDTELEYFKNSGTLAMIDLNYFKAVNDTFGHIIGDKVLLYMANNLKTISKNIIRYGGDEFMIVFPSTVSKDDALKKLHRLREEVLTKKLKAHDSLFKPSFSYGVAMFAEHDSVVDIIELADKNMYDDKQSIKKRVTGIAV